MNEIITPLDKRLLRIALDDRLKEALGVPAKDAHALLVKSAFKASCNNDTKNVDTLLPHCSYPGLLSTRLRSREHEMILSSIIRGTLREMLILLLACMPERDLSSIYRIERKTCYRLERYLLIETVIRDD